MCTSPRNTGDQAFSYNQLSFEAQDPNGTQRKLETITGLPYRLEFGDLAPGDTLEDNMVFEVLRATIEGSIEGADAVAVTLELLGGSSSPTSDPLLTANI